MFNASPFKLGIAIATFGLFVGSTIGTVQGGTTGSPQFLRESQSHMGTKWHIALYADNTQAANTAFRRAWEEIREIDRCLSNYSADSELNQFCRASPHEEFIQVSEHLSTVLRAATEISKQSDGYFDVTIGPLANLWRRARALHRLPTADRLGAARKKVDWRFVELGPRPRQARIREGGVKIDLGGIAKGYAVDRAVEAIRNAGIPAALVNGGGDLRAIGVTPDHQGWEVQIAGLRRKDEPRKHVLYNSALATSGDAWQYLEVDGKRYSHLIDPKTGIGSTRRMSVSVSAPTCMQADSLASALSVMPVEQGLAWIEKQKRTEASIVQVRETDEVAVRHTAQFLKILPQIGD